jgi:hypothetical protein
MARDNELRWTFSDVSATTNVAAVDRDITATPYRGGLVTLVSTANQWAVGYSDALNFTQWRNQIADNTNLVTGTATSAIPNDPILPNGTSMGEYYLRAAVAPIGFVGPEVCQFIVQGANDTGAGAAPTALNAWSQVSGIGTCPSTATGQTVSSDASATPTFTPVGACPPSGTLLMFTALGGGVGTGLAARTPYMVLQLSATTYRLTTALGGTTVVQTATTAVTSGTTLVGRNATNLTFVSLDDTSDRILFAEPMQVGDVIVFGAVGSITGLGTVGTLYYVTSVSSLGVTLSTSSGGSTVAIAGSVTSAFAGRINFSALPAVFPSSGTGTTITTAVPHGLEVGQFVVPSAAAAAGGLTNGLGYYVIATPTPLTFQVSATINGAAAAISAAPNPLFVGSKPKLVNVQMSMTQRPWLRMAVQQLNGSVVQDGYIAIYNCDISVGRDSAQVS